MPPPVDLQAWGVDTGYQDALGRHRRVPDDTVEAVVEALGAAASSSGPPAAPVRFLRPGGDAGVERPSLLVTEDGGEVAVEGRLPPDLPLGYHRLTDLEDGGVTTVVVSPGRCPLPAGAPAWGWAAQLYAVRSGSSWGMGDLADLRQLSAWAAEELGAGLTVVNPLHAALPGLPQAASPYFPSSRRFRNPLYLRVEEVPGAAALGADLDRLAAAGRALNADRRIDRDAVHRLKAEALEAVWSRSGPQGDPDFDAWCRAQGGPLDAYATFCTLVEHHGRRWRQWPEGYRHPHRPEIGRFSEAHADRVAFHRWLQWLLDRQLAAASAPLPLVQDLAVGVDPDGADAWLWQDTLADGMSVGAPPDEFNTRGQDWGLPPFDPWRLRAAAYGPFVETVRAALGHAGGLRVDHVMGLFRLFWVPAGRSPAEGTYVRYPSSDLLDIVALEAHRAGAFVVGEDLGTVEAEVRAELERRRVLSYRLLWFEEAPPRRFPERALATVTTHDLPTVAGMWTGSDLAAEKAMGRQPNDEGTEAIRRRLRTLTGLGDEAPVDDVVLGAYRALAAAPSLLLAAALDDALAVEERPNMPGSTDEWPNWSIALPVALEAIRRDPRTRRLAEVLDRRRRAAGTP